MLWFVLSSAHANTITVPLTICVDYDIQFSDSSFDGSVGPGDYWVDNDIDRPARWQYIEVTSRVETKRVQLNNDGCAAVNQLFPLQDANEFQVTLLGEAYVRGNRIELRNNNDRANLSWWGASLMEETISGLEVSDAGGTVDLVVDAVDGWQHMAVVMTAMYRNGWKLSYGTNRSCCTKEGAGWDGTCSDPTYRYAKDSAPYGPAGQQFVPILVNNGGGRESSCCGSKIPWFPGGATRSGVQAGENVQKKFSVAHELGHVVVGLRMGDYERGQYSEQSPDDGCNGDWWTPSASGGPQVLPASKRGIFQKEYMATSMREGWADFFGTWTWNSPATVAEYDSFLYHDYDLDTDRDNDAGGWIYQGTHRVGHAPEVPGEPGGTTPDAWVAGLDSSWLRAAETNVGSCGTVEVGTVAPACPDTTSANEMDAVNRSTIFDVSSMLWALFAEEGLTPNELSDLYVDTCPRVWRKDDRNFDAWAFTPAECDDGADLPWRRLEASATYNGFSTEFGAQEHWVKQ